MANFCSILIIVWMTFSTAAECVGGCSVYPSNVVVCVGERVLLTCSTNEGSSVASWHIHATDVTKIFKVYAAPVYTRQGTVQHKAISAKGYFVTDPANNETTLHINETSLLQAGLYVCTCLDELRSTANTPVVVLKTEPKFTTDNSATDGEPVIFSCSLSFNASSDVSCELKIEDTSGSTVSGRYESTVVDNRLTVCNLKHTIIANASSDQWLTCNVTLSTKGDIIYSKVLNATNGWQSISSTAEFLSSVNMQHEERDEETGKTLAIGLSVTIFAVIIPIAVVIYFIMRSKIRSTMFPRQDGRYDRNKIGCPTSEVAAKSCHDDGYYAEEVIYNEIK